MAKKHIEMNFAFIAVFSAKVLKRSKTKKNEPFACKLTGPFYIFYGRDGEI